MDYYLGLSIECNAFPFIIANDTPDINDYSFGVAAYALGNNYAHIEKNTHLNSNKCCLSEKLYKGKPLGFSTLLFSYALRTIHNDERDIGPYKWTYAGRVWTLVAELDLMSHSQQKITSGLSPTFYPVGISEGEAILCWIVEQVHKQGGNSLADIGWFALQELLKSVGLYGSINLLLSDGQDLIAYHNSSDKEPLYMLNAIPPHDGDGVEFEKLGVKFNGPDLNHTIIVFTNQRYSNSEDLIAIKKDQLVVARNGELIWDSNMSLEPAKEVIEQHWAEAIKVEPPKPISVDNPLVLSHIYQVPIHRACKDISQGAHPLLNISSFDRKSTPMLYYIYHESHYSYSDPVHMSKHLLRLQPVHDQVQNLIRYQLTATANGRFYDFGGVFGNNATLFDVMESYTVMNFTSRSLVAVNEVPPYRYDLLHQQWSLPLIWMPWDRIMLQAYLTPPELAESELLELSEYAMSFVKRNNNCVIDVLNDINQTIFREYEYLSGSTTMTTTPFQVYCDRRGVCQDFANLFICLARLLNIPARYRVGYIYTGSDYANKEQGDATHAWVELYLPNVGWLGFDPTNNCPQGHNHIRIACGRNYRDATPTSGTIYRGGGEEDLYTTVRVVRLTQEEFYAHYESFGKDCRSSPH